MSFPFAHSHYALCVVCHVVTMRKTMHLEMGGKTPLSLKTRKKRSQQRASRSHKPQKPRQPQQGNAVELAAARPWTWVLQHTTQETSALKTRYSPFCLFVFGYFTVFSRDVALHCLQATVRQSSSGGIADLLVIDPAASQSTTTGD